MTTTLERPLTQSEIARQYAKFERGTVWRFCCCIATILICGLFMAVGAATISINRVATTLGYASPMILSISSTLAFFVSVHLVGVVKFRHGENPYRLVEDGEGLAKHLLGAKARTDPSVLGYFKFIRDEGRQWTHHDLDVLLAYWKQADTEGVNFCDGRMG